ncbi:hypothetical protein LZ023_28270 [Pseudomonas silvicola]|nr:hypothetical protein LZ023_28270 [Pseudomonas silvicola]
MSIFDTRTAVVAGPAIAAAMRLTPLHKIETLAKQRGMLKKWTLARNSLSSNYTAERKNIEEFQLGRLQFVVDWAFENCLFYRELYSSAGYELGAIRDIKDFECLPLITKDDLIEGFPRRIVSSKHDLSKLRWMSTSGSSGKQVQMVFSEGRTDLDTLFRLRMFEVQLGESLRPDEWIYNINFVPLWYSSFCGHHPVLSIKPECNSEDLAAHIKLLRPKLISCIGSYLDIVGSCGDVLRDAGVKLISTNSEFTSSRGRMELEKELGVSVLDEYSSEELNIIAFECPFHEYHVSEDDVYVEIVGSDDRGRVVGTDLWNTAMPIIRYDQGDLAEFCYSNEKCACGSYYRRLNSLHGRADQNFIAQDGRTIRSAVLLDVVEQCFCIEPLFLKEFRVVQSSLSSVKVLFVPIQTIPQGFFDKFEVIMVSLFGHVLSFDYITMPSIPKSASYKRRTFICEV